MSIYDLVMAWCQSKTKYLDEPITLNNLEAAKQKAQEFSVPYNKTTNKTVFMGFV